MIGFLFDLSLILVTLWLAWRMLSHEDLFVSVVLFITFGLLMSLVWARLGASDVALAEATIGAGITGALLLDALWGLDENRKGSRERTGALLMTGAKGAPWVAAGSALLTLLLGIALVPIIFGLAQAPGGLTAAVAAAIGNTGVDQPVTAVLVDFRGYDTLLEMAVLLLTGVGMLAVRRACDLSRIAQEPADDVPIVWMVRLLLPVLVLSALHLLLLGTSGAGGGFQSGALFAATAILLLLAGHPSVTALNGVGLRSALVVGLGIFLVVAVGMMALGGRLLEYPRGSASGLVLLIEAAMVVATGVTLAVLFAGARPVASGEIDPRNRHAKHNAWERGAR